MFSLFGKKNNTKKNNGPKRNWTEFATGMPPLHRAIRFKKNEEVKKLLEDPSVDPNKRAGDKSTPLIMAARVANVEAVKMLLANPKVDPTLTYRDPPRTAAGEARLFMSETRNAAKQAVYNQIASDIDNAIQIYSSKSAAAPAARRRKETRKNRKNRKVTRKH